MTLRDLILHIGNNPKNFYPTVGSFVDSFRATWDNHHDIDKVLHLVEEEPQLGDGPSVAKTFLAAMVDALFTEIGHSSRVPQWTKKVVYYLGEPTYWVKEPGQFARALQAQAHPCFACRNLFFSKDVLKRV